MISWPSDVPSPPLNDTLSITPFRAPLATDMEDGNRRRRRASTKNIATLQFRIKMPAAAFAEFKTWVRDDLVDGVLPFTVPVWVGEDLQNRVCSFTEPYSASFPDKTHAEVTVSLDVEDY